MLENYKLFDKNTQAIIFGLQQRAIQRMLDFDYVCERETPSIAAIVNPTGSDGYLKCFFGPEEIILPIYSTIEKATTNHPQADVMINFASFRSAYPRTKEALEIDSIRTVAIIAEGIPERYTKELAAIAFETAKLEAKAVQVKADADSYKNRKLVQAGLTPQERMEMEIKIADVVSKNLAGPQGIALPKTYIGGSGNGASGDAFQQLMALMMSSMVEVQNQKTK